ncbi:MAG TPA: ribbon-helix-helix protein, CopG family [Candidatus Acidoferrales bacterium]
MAKTTSRKLGLEIDARLYARLDQVARRNGQSRRFLLEQALKHYLEVVAPSEGTLRPEVLRRFRRSVEKNRKLMKLLAD